MELVSEFKEAESAYRSGKPTWRWRARLKQALRECKRHKAMLVIAALDRLARNVVFIATLIETRVNFTALDMPDATPFMIARRRRCRPPSRPSIPSIFRDRGPDELPLRRRPCAMPDGSVCPCDRRFR